MPTLNHNGQVYTLLRTEPYTRRDGTETFLDTWGAACTFPGCASIYTVTVPHGFTEASTKAFGSRRCADHKMTKSEVTERWQAAIKASREARKKLQT